MVDGLIPLNVAAKQVGVSTTTLRRRAQAGELTLYTTALNRRERLVRADDLAKYAEPRPIAVQPSDNGDRVPAA